MNFIAIIVAAVAAFIIGFLWHGPLFGKLWMQLANIHPTGKEKLVDMWKQMVSNMVSNLVIAFVLSGTFMLVFTSTYMGEASVFRGAICAAWLWFGFVVTATSMDVIWMGKSWKLWLFEIACSFVSLVAMGAIIGAWM